MSEAHEEQTSMETTPTNGVVSPEVTATAPEPEPQAPAAPAPVAEPPQVKVPARDFEAELAVKDKALEDLQVKINAVQGATKEHQKERQQLMTEVTRLINERQEIESAKNAEIEEKTGQLEEASKATQALSQKTQTLEQELQSERAKATKLEVLVNEFPDLLGFSHLIPASADAAEVRGYCQQLNQAVEAKLTDYRQKLGVAGSMRTVPTGTPATRPMDFTDATQLEQRLQEAMGKSPEIFQEEIRAAIANLEARRPR